MNQLEEFDAYVEQLKKHDWTYDYSDDSAVWSRGKANERELRSEAVLDPRMQAAYDAYLTYHFGNQIDHGANKAIRDASIEALRHQIKVEMTEALINPQPTTV